MSRWSVYPIVRLDADGKKLPEKTGKAVSYRVQWRIDGGNPRRRVFTAQGYATTFHAKLLTAQAGLWDADDRGEPLDPDKSPDPTLVAVSKTVAVFAEEWWSTLPRKAAATEQAARINLDLLLTALCDEHGQSLPITEALTASRLNQAMKLRRETNMLTRAFNEREAKRAAEEGRPPKLRVETASANTERSFRVTMGTFVKAAHSHGLIASNPLEAVLTTKATASPVSIRRVLSLAEVQRLAKLVAAEPDGERYRALIIVAGTTGLRPGELCGLRREDVFLDADDPHLLIDGTERGGKRSPLKHRPAGEERNVPLAPVTVAALRLHLDSGWAGEQYVFTSPRGQALDLSNWQSRYWDPVMPILAKSTKKPCPPGTGIRWLRKTAITWWLTSGIDVYQAAKWAGHSPQVLLDHYAGVIDLSPRSAIGKLAANTPETDDEPVRTKLHDRH